jgi:hypothetical protein
MPGIAQGMDRKTAVAALTLSGLSVFKAENFVERKNNKGQPLYVCEKISDGAIASIIGPPENISEIFLMVQFNDDNMLSMGLALANITEKSFPELKNALQWVTDMMTALANLNRGEQTLSGQGKTLSMTLGETALCTFSIKFTPQ